MNIFERASRAKLRFQSKQGSLSTEDLWDLSLERLDTIAKEVNRKLKLAVEESFISTKPSENTEVELALEILKHVIASKITTQEASKKRAELNAQKEQIRSILMNKKNEALSNKSVEELEAILNGM